MSSTTTGVSSSSSGSYAVELAQTSHLKRSLHSLDRAIQNGNLSSARSSLVTLINALPKYTPPPDDPADTADPINKGFQAVAKALDDNNADAAKKAWTQVKSDLAKAGVSDITDGKADTAKLLADAKASMNSAIIGKMFGIGSDDGASVTTLLGAKSTSSSDDSVNAAIAKWLNYEADGKTHNIDDNGSGGTLDKKA
jgi:hypothetical protein